MCGEWLHVIGHQGDGAKVERSAANLDMESSVEYPDVIIVLKMRKKSNQKHGFQRRPEQAFFCFIGSEDGQRICEQPGGIVKGKWLKKWGFHM